MDNNDVSIHSSHESNFGPEELDRRVILEPIVQRVIDALLMPGIMQALFGMATKTLITPNSDVNLVKDDEPKRKRWEKTGGNAIQISTVR